jgi:hypothetical protein
MGEIDMIRWVLRQAIGKFERDFDYDASYMRDIIDASPRAAWLFSRVTALGSSGATSRLRPGARPASRRCATKTAARARNWPSPWPSVPA